MKHLDADTESALKRGKQQVLDAHGDDPNVTGAGIGFRFRAGRWTDEPVVTVMVAKKRPEALVSRGRLLPKTVQVDGEPWGIDVVEGGPFILHRPPVQSAHADGIQDADALAQMPLARDVSRDALARDARATLAGSGSDSLTQKERPPLQGCSISNLADGQAAGTLSCFVRDATDGAVCILSCNHVLARLGQGTPDQAIIQPGGFDGGVNASNRIAGLKRWAPLVNGTEVDAAIAQLDDQSAYSVEFTDGLMAPISPTHPAVGMVVAGDPYGISGFLTRMDATLAGLRVELLGGDPPLGGVGSSAEVKAPRLGMNIEKVGRTTGYTSATILGLSFNILVETDASTTVAYKDLIWVMLFQLAGDSGSVACSGGPGNLAQAELFLASLGKCVLLDAIGTYYNLPLSTSQNNTLADDLRDEFLSQSSTGQLLVAATYVNGQTVIDRLNSDTGAAHNQSLAQAKAQSLYTQYHDLAATLITSTSPTAVVTASEIGTVASILHGLATPPSASGTGMLTAAESSAAWALFSDVLKPTVGMGRQQLIGYMNEMSVFERVSNEIAAVPTIQMPGPVSTYRRSGK